MVRVRVSIIGLSVRVRVSCRKGRNKGRPKKSLNKHNNIL